MWVFTVNVGLCAVAIATVPVPGPITEVVALLGGAILVISVLAAFEVNEAATRQPRPSGTRR